MTCPQCATDVAPSLLACPACHGLLYPGQLKELAAAAAAAESAADISAQIAAWRQALTPLPPGSHQYAVVAAKVEDLSREVDRAAPAPSGGSRRGWAGGALSGVALLLWKLKAIAILVLSQGKLLLLGLTKSSTLVSMLGSLGVYWAAYGWRFAAGLVGSIYVHEMGHVAALRRLGIPASPPMFIPSFGAVVRAGLGRATPREDARVGLAGPIWGFGAALAAYVIFLAGGGPFWAAIARVGALINLFNLLPVWQLDGARAFHPMNRVERSIAAAAIVTMFLATREHLLVLLAVMAIVQIVRADGQTNGDRLSLIQYSGLVIILSLMSTFVVSVGF